MTSQQIRFDDGAAYERMMGGWSRLAGETFLQWLKPSPGRRWIDVGCGNGAFTELVLDKCAPDSVLGVDPSEGQLDYARQRLSGRPATFHRGDAMSLSVPDRSVEVAVMALVIFFVPEPERGVAEMVRVVQPGGLVGAYAWDVLGGGFTQEPIQAEMRAIGLVPTLPPRADASQTSALETLWKDAGLWDVEVRQIDIARTFESFDDYWSSSLAGMTGQKIAALPVAQQEELKVRVRKRFPVDDAGRVVCTARANAVKGRVRA